MMSESAIERFKIETAAPPLIGAFWPTLSRCFPSVLVTMVGVARVLVFVLEMLVFVRMRMLANE